MTTEKNPRPTTTPARSHVSRRTLVAGTAWAVPAVVVATAAPAVAASTPTNTGGGGSCTFTFDTRGSCRIKDPNGPGYTGYLVNVNALETQTCQVLRVTLTVTVGAETHQILFRNGLRDGEAFTVNTTSPLTQVQATYTVSAPGGTPSAPKTITLSVDPNPTCAV